MAADPATRVRKGPAMPVYALGELVPEIHPQAYNHP
jgi:hypothetical protein